MKLFSIIFYKGNSLTSQLIRKVTKSQSYSHCAFVLDEFHCLESAWNNPCVVKHFKYKSNEYDVYELNIDLTDDEIEKLKQYIMKYLNSGYDYSYLVSRGLNNLIGTPIYNSKETVTCDELVVSAYRHIGINLYDSDEMLTPELLSKSELLRKIE